MFRMTLLACSVTVSILFLNMLLALDRIANYESNVDFDERSCFSTDVVLSVPSDSALTCLAICSGKRCATIFYNAENKSCTGCYTLYTQSSDLPPSPGSRAYMFNFDCDVGEERYNTSCYSWTNGLTWSNAKTYCASVINRFLAVPETREEFVNISSWLRAQTNFDYAYLGLSDLASEGTWRTIHGEEIGYTEWNVKEPNGASVENCLAFDILEQWHDVRCWAPLHLVCEKDMIAM